MYISATGAEEKQGDMFPFFLDEHARTWFDNLKDASDFKLVREAFVERFKDDVLSGMWDIKQNTQESGADYLTRFLQISGCCDMDENHRVQLFIRGLRPSLRSMVTLKNPKKMEDTRLALTLAERSETYENDSSAQTEKIVGFVQQLQEMVLRQEINSTVVRSDDRHEKTCRKCGLNTGVNRLCVVTLIILTFGCGSVQGQEFMQRLNYGVIFKPEGNLILANEEWLHTYEIELPRREISILEK
ncbi:hypothetical protein ACF0H5_022624 [Mactra antiquata]